MTMMAALVWLLAPGLSAAQGLSDGGGVFGYASSSGYMGLGGNLGRAIVPHRAVKAAKPSKAARTARPTSRGNHLVKSARYQRPDSPMYLTATVLDNSGLNINSLDIGSNRR
jgi:hypothetical protein